MPDECAGGWQATEKPVFLSDECADGWRTAEKSVIKGEYVSLRRFCSPLNFVINKEYVEFLVGRDGDFDILAASVVKRCQREIRDDNSNLIWILPYLTSNYRKNEIAYRNYYDEIEVFPNTGHYKSAFRRRNRFMIDRSDLVLCCIERDSGGAFQSVRYAERVGKQIINVAASIEQSEDG